LGQKNTEKVDAWKGDVTQSLVTDIKIFEISRNFCHWYKLKLLKNNFDKIIKFLNAFKTSSISIFFIFSPSFYQKLYSAIVMLFST
jgi:hypothetical protein